jgi:hydrogenase-4 component F
MALLLLLIPLLTAGMFWTTKNKNLINAINASGITLLLCTTLYIVGQVLKYGNVKLNIASNIIYIDSLSALILIVTAGVAFLVSLYSIIYMNEEYKRKVVNSGKLRIYYTLLHTFIFTMVLTLTTQNIGLIWIAVEATTLASAFLVGFYNNKKSIEAAWKYIIICSVGIAFAMLGIVMLYYSSMHVLGESAQGLNWTYLFENAGKLQGGILKISFIFILVGFGTKVGLAPMHTWLPDAHSQAPSPISALLSGVLLNTAMYSIMRVMVIVNKNTGSNAYTSKLLLILGILSIGTAAVFIIVQQDFKRLLAYSSIEHMGIIAFGLGILSPLSVFGSLFHIVNHAFTKSMLFIASGNIYLRYDTKKISKINGVLKTLPVTGVAFIIGIFAITGMPPFSVFSSEINIIIASIKESKNIYAILMLLFLILVFAGFIAQLMKMFFGKPIEHAVEHGESNRFGSAILVVFILIITVMGIYIPGPLKNLIDSAGNIVRGVNV